MICSNRGGCSFCIKGQTDRRAVAYELQKGSDNADC